MTTGLGSLVTAALTYAVVVSDVWVFAVLPVVPAAVLAGAGLGATLLTHSPRRLIALGVALAAVGAALTLGYVGLWAAQFDYVDTGRPVPHPMARWDQITFVGSAVVCALSIMLAIAVLGRSWRRSTPNSVSTQVQATGAGLPLVRY